MSLIKKIWKTAAAGALGLGILAGCSTMQNVQKMPYSSEAKSETGITIEEAKRYGRLFVSASEDDIFLTWDRNEDGRIDIFANYGQEKRANYVLLRLKSILEDRNNNHEFEENERSERNEEYQEFVVMEKDGLLHLGKDTDKDNAIDTEYIYQAIDLQNDGKNLYAKLELIEIRKDRNRNRRWDKNETLWKKEKRKTEIEEDREKYGKLFFGAQGDNLEIFLGWDTDKDGREDIRCDYIVMKGKEEREVYLILKKNYEDKNRDGVFTKEEIVPNKEEYKEFFMRTHPNGLFSLGKDEDRNGFEDKRYLYEKKEPLFKKDMLTIEMDIIGVQKDLNGDHIFDANELVWKKNGIFIPLPRPKQSPDPIREMPNTSTTA